MAASRTNGLEIEPECCRDERLELIHAARVKLYVRLIMFDKRRMGKASLRWRPKDGTW